MEDDIFHHGDQAMAGDAAGDNYGNTTGNHSDSVCEGGGTVPKAQDLFTEHPMFNIIYLAVALVFTIITLIIFIEEVVFVHKHFVLYKRKVLTIWVLAIYPVFSVCANLGLFIPRAGTLVDLVSNVYFATCLYQFVRLMINYIGGKERMFRVLGETTVSLRAPPCCCCCICLPTVAFSSSTFNKIQLMALQVTIVRPLVHFVAAVLWANGSYSPGMIAWDNGYIYIVCLNLTSTFTAVYGLLLLQNTFKPVLGSYHLGGKFLSIQSVLLLTVIPNIIISILVSNGTIPCTPTLPSKIRGERLYHSFVVVLMLPLSLMGRGFYRRQKEGAHDENMNGLDIGLITKGVEMENKEVMTSQILMA